MTGIEALGVSALFPQQTQRQDSTTAQLVTVLAAANRLGCYDAFDAIYSAFFPATGSTTTTPVSSALPVPVPLPPPQPQGHNK